ncbi:MULTISPECIES: S8 family serine peptidase [unclassified Bacillus (in: firmicutes)]|uniref:S8 family serine peptidase n=1 Tax=unclassified Bacillus (in: firmicutes) TaxID=185979 RepID=UPI0008E1EF61|nr:MULTISPECIES: S8 family serine peptidase [unclassified Bacillus (in: firmicutes)]SFA70205.1 subtilisin [Bacillus sp. UNCCL13]SFQ59772.1 subtilisin [Bacillus sp. cl95]
MKKRKVIGTGILSFAMGISLFTTGAFGQVADSNEMYRVQIKGPAVEKALAKKNFGSRWDFGSEGFTTEVNAKQYASLLKNKNLTVEKVQEVQLETRTNGKIGATAITSLPSDRTPWGIQAIYNDSTVTSTSGGAGINVAVLDTGVFTNHIDLQGQAEQCKDFTQTSSSMVNGSCTDRNGHGTHVAGTVLAQGGTDGLGVYGVAPDADLWAYKVLTDSGSGYSDDISAAIRHAADQAVSTGTKTIISMSLGSSSKDTLIASAVDYAYGKGVLVVAAAGNSGSGNNTIGYPGALVNAVAVAALENVQSNGTYRVADYSSRGNSATDADYVIQERDIEVSAPGSAIESTWYDGNYNTISGTSMATPHVSGLAAKIWSANPSWSHTQLRAELQRRAKLYDIKGGIGATTGDDYASGYGFPRVK